jgi:hypothetical protein
VLDHGPNLGHDCLRYLLEDVWRERVTESVVILVIVWSHRLLA